MKIHSVCMATLILGGTVVGASAEIDVFMRAVGYALTGSDNAEPKVIDRKNCVFGVDGDIFRINNVHVDRIKIQGWKKTTGFMEQHYVTVTLHGDQTVYETTSKPPVDDGSEAARQLKQAYPETFKPQHSTSKEQTLKLQNADQDRVGRAWEYIYSNGCVGKKSPF